MALRGSTKPISDLDAVAEARRLADRAGMSLRDWLDAVIDGSVDEVAPPRRQSTAAAARPENAARDRRRQALDQVEAGLDDLERRLSRGSRDKHAAAAATDLTDRFPPARGRAAETEVERRLGRLVDAVGGDEPIGRDEAPEALRAIAGRLDRLGGAVARDDLERRAARDTVRQLEERLEQIARRMETPARPPLATARPIGSGRERPLADSRVSPAALDGLKEAIAEIATRQRSLETSFDRAVATYADRIDHRLDTVAERLERTLEEAPLRGQRHPDASRAEFDALRRLVGDLADRIDSMPARVAEDFAGRLEDTARRLDTATRSELDAIRGELREIAQDLDRSARAEFHALRTELRELADRVERTPTSSASSLEAMIEDVALRLDTAARSEFAEIRSEIREIARAIDAAGRSEFESLRGEIQALGDRLSAGERSRTRERDDREFEAVRAEIRALAEQIDDARQSDYSALRGEMRALGERVGTVSAPQMAELEQHLSMLANRLDSAASEGDATALAQIERQIARLAEQVDASTRRVAGLDGLDRTLEDLFSRLDQSRADAMEAARAAAQEAVERAMASLARDTGGDPDILEALKRELAEQRANAEAADRRTEETLRAVHETLKKIVGRLEDLEDEIEGAAARPQARAGELPAGREPAPEPTVGAAPEDRARVPEPDAIVDRINAVTRSFREAVPPDPADDVPLEPGTRRPRTEPEVLAAEPTRKADFIAAARRAAQAATREATREAVADEPAAPIRDRKRLAAVGAALARYRRPLAILVAMLLVIYGAMKLAAILRSDSAVLSLLETPEAGQVETADTTPPQRPPHQTVDNTKEAGSAIRQIIAAAEPVAKADVTGSIPTPATIDQAVGAEPAPAAAASAPALQQDAIPALPESIGPQKLREAALSGDPAAQFEIAIRYMDGRGVPQDYAEAARWYRLAAAQGLAPAQYRLGSMYEKGHGVGRDLAMARMWYQRAAERGNRKAMHNLAVLYADGIDGTPDFEKAATWFRQAAEHGLADSQYNLAILYARGMGVAVDLVESFRWFAIAADQGDREALAKRDEIARNLDEQQLARARAALDSFTPKPVDPAANVVAEPQGGWGDALPPVRQALGARESIATVQSLLSRLGYAPGPADGEMGPRTRDAIRAFQRSVGMPDTGEVSEELIERLTRSAG